MSGVVLTLMLRLSFEVALSLKARQPENHA